jgi:hypothetical protein
MASPSRPGFRKHDVWLPRLRGFTAEIGIDPGVARLRGDIPQTGSPHSPVGKILNLSKRTLGAAGGAVMVVGSDRVVTRPRY